MIWATSSGCAEGVKAPGAHGMSDAVIGVERSNALLAACWSLGEAGDVRALTALARP